MKGGHLAVVNSVAFAREGRIVLSGSADKTVRIWSTTTGLCLRTLRGHLSPVLTVSVLPDSSQAVSAGMEGSIRVWDLETGICVAVLEGNSSHVWALGCLDNKRIVSGDFDRQVRIRDLSSPGGSSTSVGTHPAEVRSLAVLPGGDRIAVGLIGNEVCTDINIWDVAKSDKPVMSYRGHGDTVSSMAPFAGRGGLVSAGFDKTVRVWWDRCDEEGEPTLEIRSGIPLSVDSWKDGKGFAVGVEDGSVRIWDHKQAVEALHLAERHVAGVACVAVSGDGKLMASGGADKAVRLLKVDDGKGVGGDMVLEQEDERILID